MKPLSFLLPFAACLLTATCALAKAPAKKTPEPKAPAAEALPMDWAAFLKATQHGHAREATAQAIADLQRAWLPWHHANDAFNTLEAAVPPAAGETKPRPLNAALRQSLAKPDPSAVHLLRAAFDQDDRQVHEESDYGATPMKRGLLL